MTQTEFALAMAILKRHQCNVSGDMEWAEKHTKFIEDQKKNLLDGELGRLQGFEADIQARFK